MIEYKGYVAAVEFDESVDRLHGRVVNSGAYPIATFEAADVDGVRHEFERSIDEYRASCREDGIEPKSRSRHPQPAARPRPAPARRALGHRARREPEQLDQAGGGGEGVAVTHI